jgi:hypothetical protein
VATSGARIAATIGTNARILTSQGNQGATMSKDKFTHVEEILRTLEKLFKSGALTSWSMHVTPDGMTYNFECKPTKVLEEVTIHETFERDEP